MADCHGKPGSANEAAWLEPCPSTPHALCRYATPSLPRGLCLLSDLAKSDLLPASTIFVPLPSSSLHYLVGKLTPLGISFELLRLARVPADSGIGIKLAVRDRSPMDLAKLKARRHANGEERIQTQARNGDPVKQEGMTGFEVENRDLKDLFIYCK